MYVYVNENSYEGMSSRDGSIYCFSIGIFGIAGWTTVVRVVGRRVVFMVVLGGWVTDGRKIGSSEIEIEMRDERRASKSANRLILLHIDWGREVIRYRLAAAAPLCISKERSLAGF